MKENRKIKRTKTLLRDALLGMLQEMPLQAVSIRDLCKKAGINRSTFYNHYGSQYDLLEEIKQNFLAAIAARLAEADPDNRESVLERVTTVLEYLSDNPELSRLLLNNSADADFENRIFALPKINDLLDRSLQNCEDPEKKNAVIAFAVHGSCRLLQDWLNKEERVSAKDEAELILELARRVCC